MRIRQAIPRVVSQAVVFLTVLALGVPASVALAAAPPAAAAALAGPAFALSHTVPLPTGFKSIKVDPATKRVFVSSPASSVVTVLDATGAVIASLPVPGAGALLIDGPTLYVAGTTVGRIDAFDTSTLAAVGSLGSGVLFKPNALAKAGGRIWTTTGACAESAQLVSIDPSTGATTVFPAKTGTLYYCPFLFTNPADPNMLLGFDVDLSPATLVRMDVSSGSPVVTATLWTDVSNAQDGRVMPDGKTLALAAGWPYEIRTFNVNPLSVSAVVYPTGPYPDAIDATSAAGGLFAAGRNGIYDNDLDVFRLGDPSQTLFRYDFGTTSNTILDAGLAFSPDGRRLYAVTGEYSTSASLNVFGPPDPGGRYTPLTPARILDTRDGTGGLAGPVGSGATVDVQVTGRGGVPETGVAAVAVNVTVTQPTAGGYLTIYPSGAVRPVASNLNFTAGETIPNLVVVKVGAGGRVSMFNSAGATHVVFDVAGWYSDAGPGATDAGRYTALAPARILDTRSGAGGGVRLGPGASLDLQVTGRGGVPAGGVAAVVLNVAVTETTAPSYLTIHPTGEARPLAANLNFVGGQTVSNRVIAKLGAGGRVTIYNAAGSTDVVVDVGGWYGDGSVAIPGGVLTPVTPARILDTRDSTSWATGPLAAGATIDLQVAGRAGVPVSGASAVVLNVTVVDAAAGGWLTEFPTATARPLASDLNYAALETRPNLAIVQLGAGGQVSIFSPSATHLVVDVAGWIS